MSEIEEVILLMVFVGLLALFIGPLIHIVTSRRSHGGAKFGWILAYLFFSWTAYIVFLIITQKTADQNNRKINKFKFISFVTIFHFLLTSLFFIASDAYLKNHFDAGLPAGVIEKVLMFAMNTLFFPLIFPFSPAQWLPEAILNQFVGAMGYLPIFLNSLIWGICFWLIYSRIKKTEN